MPVFYCQKFILFINDLGLFIYQDGRRYRTDVHFCVANRNTK
ncbi:hypothetical protein KPK_1139 [Klebsiella variicola]|uniref:Uncharacterized protein n=1 Tax=Klebsiella variicola (strain 342) TaxID=507522 RepID=B5XVF4_KLEV3|nr:hypothetical protein KPK_1139 [Klebsiella variicola]